MEQPQMYIGCIPVAFSPTPPPEQKGCVEEGCPQCGQKMWVSEKKRAKREHGIPCWCMMCVVQELHGNQGIGRDEVDVVDILNTH